MTFRPEMPITTRNLVVGFTTDVEALGTVSAPATITFDLDTPQLKTITVDGDTGTYTFAVPDPSGVGGTCEVYITATGTANTTVNSGSSVAFTNGSPMTLTTGTDYWLKVTKFSNTNAVMQFIEL